MIKLIALQEEDMNRIEYIARNVRVTSSNKRNFDVAYC